MGFSLSVELVGAKRKTLIGNLFQAPFAIGESIVALIAMGIRDWKTFQIVVSAPIFLLLLLYFILPESPRWLIATGRYKQAKKILENAAAKNKVRSQLSDASKERSRIEFSYNTASIISYNSITRSYQLCC